LELESGRGEIVDTCITLFFGVIIIIIGIGTSIDWIRGKILDKRIAKALKRGDYIEYSRLVNFRNIKENQLRQAQSNLTSDQDYIEGMFILDAAEQGVFFPTGHEVFERMGDQSTDNYENYDDFYYDEDYYYEEDYDDPQHADHWGLG
jgi:hypothetical protein